MMKKLLIILILSMSFYSCESQNESIDITGNWYNFSNTTANELFYVETFIDNEKFQYFNEFSGLMEEEKYKIKNNFLYKISADNEEHNVGKIKIIDINTFSLNSKNHTIVVKRVLDDIKLSDYLSNQISEKEFWKIFLRRKEIWKINR